MRLFPFVLLAVLGCNSAPEPSILQPIPGADSIFVVDPLATPNPQTQIPDSVELELSQSDLNSADRLNDIAGLYLKEQGAWFHNLKPRLGPSYDTIPGANPAFWIANYSPKALLETYTSPTSPAARACKKDRSEPFAAIEDAFRYAVGARSLNFNLNKGWTYANSFVDAWHFKTEQEAQRAEEVLTENREDPWPKTMTHITRKGKVVHVFHASSMGSSWEMKKVFEIFRDSY